MDEFIKISSDDRITDLEHHFKVIAGPGAGKTYWLINHIQNVLRNSRKISSSSKIACITYTNVAADEIRERLKENGNKVEISTIHSFLYNNIVRNYIHLLSDNLGNYIVNFDKLDGHDEHKPIKSKIITWLNETDKINFRKIITKNKEIFFDLCSYLQGLKWIPAINKCSLVEDFKKKRPKYFPSTSEEEYRSYKKLFWKDGTIHYEDVLYFSYEILMNFPIVQEFVSSRFRYIFVDEFQDTNPIQTIILKWLAENGSYIGVIGDTAQSIYGFQDARPQDFGEFRLPGQIDYVIEDNRRSTNKIVNLLNHIRRDSTREFCQNCIRDIEGNKVVLFVGEKDKCIAKFVKLCGKNQNITDYSILSRNNESVSKIRLIINFSEAQNRDEDENTDIWNIFREIDYERERFIFGLFEAMLYSIDNSYTKAIEKTIKVFRTSPPLKSSDSLKSDKKLERSIALCLVSELTKNYDEIFANNMYFFYDLVDKVLKRYGISLKDLRDGKPKNFLKNTSSSTALDCLRLSDEKNSQVRTIHKAKGAEFDGVLIVCEKETDFFNRIIKPDITKEECRIYYVASSRAKNLLCFSIPELSDNNKRKVQKLGFEFIEC